MSDNATAKKPALKELLRAEVAIVAGNSVLHGLGSGTHDEACEAIRLLIAAVQMPTDEGGARRGACFLANVPVVTGSGDALREALDLIRSAHEHVNTITVQRGKLGPIATQAQTASHALAKAETILAALSTTQPTTAAGQIAENANCSAADTESIGGVKRE